MGLLISEVQGKVLLSYSSSGLWITPRLDLLLLNDPEAIKEAEELRRKYNAGEPILIEGITIRKKIKKDEKDNKDKKTSFWKRLFGH